MDIISKTCIIQNVNNKEFIVLYDYKKFPDGSYEDEPLKCYIEDPETGQYDITEKERAILFYEFHGILDKFGSYEKAEDFITDSLIIY